MLFGKPYKVWEKRVFLQPRYVTEDKFNRGQKMNEKYQIIVVAVIALFFTIILSDGIYQIETTDRIAFRINKSKGTTHTIDIAKFKKKEVEIIDI